MVLVTDNGPVFAAKNLLNFPRLMVSDIISVPYHPAYDTDLQITVKSLSYLFLTDTSCFCGLILAQRFIKTE